MKTENKDKMTRQMEYLLAMLKKEWERSGTTIKPLPIGRIATTQLAKYAAETVSAIDEDLEWYDYSFAQTIKATKKTFVLLRLLRKTIEASHKMDERGSDCEIIELDAEEYAAYKKAVAYFQTQKEDMTYGD